MGQTGENRLIIKKTLGSKPLLANSELKGRSTRELGFSSPLAWLNEILTFIPVALVTPVEFTGDLLTNGPKGED